MNLTERENAIKSMEMAAKGFKEGIFGRACKKPLGHEECIANKYALFVFDHPEWFIDEVEDECESFFDIISRCLTKYFESKLGINPVVEL